MKRRPYGTPAIWDGTVYPTLKRGANKLCACGARIVGIPELSRYSSKGYALDRRRFARRDENDADCEPSGGEALEHFGGFLEPGAFAAAEVGGHGAFFVEDFLRPLAGFGNAALGGEHFGKVQVGF